MEKLLSEFFTNNKEWIIPVISSPIIVLFFQKRESVFRFPIKYMSVYSNKDYILSTETRAMKDLIASGIAYSFYILIIFFASEYHITPIANLKHTYYFEFFLSILSIHLFYSALRILFIEDELNFKNILLSFFITLTEGFFIILGNIFFIIAFYSSLDDSPFDFLLLSCVCFFIYFCFAIFDIKISVKDVVGKKYDSIILHVADIEYSYCVKLENFKQNHDSMMFEHKGNYIIIKNDRILMKELCNSKD